jgi:hypothetical protein
MRKCSIVTVLIALLTMGVPPLGATASDPYGMQAQSICGDSAAQDRIDSVWADFKLNPTQQAAEAIVAADLSAANVYVACASPWIGKYPVKAAFCWAYAAWHDFWAAREQHIIHEDYSTSLSDAYDNAQLASMALDTVQSTPEMQSSYEKQKRGLQSLIDEINNARQTWGAAGSSQP